jgi:hypothetical protein
MGQIKFDMQYGVRRLDEGAMVKVDTVTGSLPTFMGIPFVESLLATESKVFKKIWKRLGRPSKVRIRHKTFPSVFMFEGKIIIHPELRERITLICERRANKQRKIKPRT